MATTVIPGTVTVPADIVIDAIAALHALGRYDEELAGRASGRGGVASNEVGDWCYSEATRLQDAAFGPRPHDDDEWTKFAPEVERQARAGEITALLLEKRISDEAWELRERARRARLDGAAIREHGDITAVA